MYHGTLYEPSFLRDLIHDVVQTIRKNLKVDWTEPYREDVKASVRAAVKRILRKRGVKEEHFEVFLEAASWNRPRRSSQRGLWLRDACVGGRGNSAN